MPLFFLLCTGAIVPNVGIICYKYWSYTPLDKMKCLSETFRGEHKEGEYQRA